MRKICRTLLAAVVVGSAVVALTTTSLASAAVPEPEVVTVTPDGWFTEADFSNAPTLITMCGNRDAGTTTCPTNQAGWPANRSSLNMWGLSAVEGDTRRSGIYMRPADPNQVTLGVPFEVMSFGVFNRQIRGDAPTSRALRVMLEIQLPGEEPFSFALDDPQSPASTEPYGKPRPWRVGILETANQAPCDPDIQVSDLPCDDRYTLSFMSHNGEPVRPVVVEKVVNGVTWKFELNGFDHAPAGAVSPSLSAPERADTLVSVVGVLTREGPDDTETTTALTGPATSTSGTSADFDATVAPTPSGGTVAFIDGDEPVEGCDAVPIGEDGTATCSTAALGVGEHQITATYGGTSGFAGSTSTALTHTVSEAGPTSPCVESPVGFTVINGSPDNDQLVGTSKKEIIDAGAGDDTIDGRGGDDIVCGGDGDDKLYGGPGDDTIDGGDGIDQLYGGLDDDALMGGAGNDRLYGSLGDDTLDGGSGTDRLDGSYGTDACTTGETLLSC